MDEEQFDTNGFTTTYDHRLYYLIPPADSEWVEEYEGFSYPKQINLDEAATYLKRTYLPDYAELGYYNYWEGSEPTAMEWHNDHIEGCDVFFIYFLNDVDIGGELMFRRTGGEITGMIQPRKHLLVKGSQKTSFEHIAVYSPEKRYVCNFGFKVEWI